jgi:hypothetical protein
MSDMSASVTPTEGGFSVVGYEMLNYKVHLVGGIFDVSSRQPTATSNGAACSLFSIRA